MPAARNLVMAIVTSHVSSHSHCSVTSVVPNVHSLVTIRLQEFNQLQWVLDSTEYSENISYATQAECPHGMTLHEYLEFTRIRSGGNLQFTNLLRALHEGMDFTLPHTLDLLVQSLWQVGPPSTDGNEEVQSNIIYFQ